MLECDNLNTPKHGSWLNIAELEFAVLGRSVFKKRIADNEQSQRELDAICAGQNAQATSAHWQFNLSKVRKKMAWAYLTSLMNQIDYLLDAIFINGGRGGTTYLLQALAGKRPMAVFDTNAD